MLVGRYIFLAAILAPAFARGVEDAMLWASTYDSPAHEADVARDVVVSSTGDIYVVGFSLRDDRGEAENILVRKYTSDGELVWSRTHNSAANAVDAALGVAAGTDGSVYVAGYIEDPVTFYRGWLRKYDSAGNEVWTSTYNKSGLAAPMFGGVAVDPLTGDIYVAGSEYRLDVLQGWDGILVKYGPTGAQLWTRTLNGVVDLNDEFLGVAVAYDRSVLVAGYASIAKNPTGPQINRDVLLRKYSPDGTIVWEKTYGSERKPLPEFYAFDLAYAVDVDDVGSVYVVGSLNINIAPGVDDTHNRWVRKYSSDGVSVLWERQIDWADHVDHGFACDVGPGNELLMAGYSMGRPLYQMANLALEKLDSGSGQVLFTVNYDATRSWTVTPGGSITWTPNEVGYGVAVSPDGSYVVVGYEERDDIGQGDNWIIQKYASQPAVEPERGNVRAYPNPFNPRTAVGGVMKFANLPSGSSVRVYTLRGRLVRNLREEGNVVLWDGRNSTGEMVGTGAYFYVIAIPGQSPLRGKMVVETR